MVINLEVSRKFVPEWNGNKSLPAGEQIEVTHKAPTLALVNRLIPKPSLKMIMGREGQMEGGESEIIMDNTKIVREMVTEIRNLTLNVDGKSRKIVSAADLFAEDVPAVLSGLVDELGSYLQGVLNKKEVDAKN